MAVKGPRLHRMVVTVDRPMRRRILMVALLLVLVAAGVGGWFAGRWALAADLPGGGDLAGAVHLERMLEENRSMREELAIYRTGGDVTRQVEEQVRVENRKLQDRVAELEQGIAYYRRVAVPDPSGKGLRIERMELAPAGTPPVWSLRLLLVRTGETDSAVEGRLDGRVVCAGPSGTVTLPLSQVLDPSRQAFAVRYVKDLQLDLRLPPGLTPVRLDLAADLTAPRADRIEKTWQRQATK